MVKETDWLYKCDTCGCIEVVLGYDPRKDGRSCRVCGEHTVPYKHLKKSAISTVVFDEMHDYQENIFK